MPREVFIAGQILTAAEMNSVSDQTVMVFAGTAARGSAIPTPVEGMVTYLEDADDLQVYTTDWAAIGRGKILQVVSTTKTDSFSTSSTSFVDVTGLSASITPIATSSKIYIIVDLVTGCDNAAGSIRLNLVRDSTNIAQATGGLLQSTAHVYTNNTSAGVGAAISFLDSPSTSSSVTYKIQTARFGAGGNVFIGRLAVADERSVSSITLIEVAG